MKTDVPLLVGEPRPSITGAAIDTRLPAPDTASIVPAWLLMNGVVTCAVGSSMSGQNASVIPPAPTEIEPPSVTLTAAAGFKFPTVSVPVSMDDPVPRTVT